MLSTFATTVVKDSVTFVPSETQSTSNTDYAMSLNGITVSTSSGGNLCRSSKDFYTISAFVKISSSVGKITKVVFTGYAKIDSYDSRKNKPEYTVNAFYKADGLSIKKATDNVATWTNNSGVEELNLTTRAGIHMSKITVYFNRNSEQISINKYGYASFSSVYALDFTGSGITAYVMTGADGTTATLNEVDKVPGNTGLLLKAEQGTYNVPLAESASAIEDNILISTATAAHKSNGDCYTLGIKDNVIGFYGVASGKVIPAKRSYFTSATGAKGFTLTDETATGILSASLSSDSSVPSVRLSSNDEHVFNLFGQPVAPSFKGLVIYKGKKYIRR